LVLALPALPASQDPRRLHQGAWREPAGGREQVLPKMLRPAPETGRAAQMTNIVIVIKNYHRTC